MKKKSLILLRYDKNKVASQRFRLENIAAHLGNENFTFIYVKKGFLNFLKSELKILSVFNCPKIIFNRWPNHYGFSIALILVSFFVDVIFDFDDAIWTSEKSSITNSYKKFIFKIHCLISKKILCGNEFLLKTVNNNKCVYIPTLLDDRFFTSHEKSKKSDHFIFGWTGSDSTLKYLEDIIYYFDLLYNEDNRFKLYYMTSSKSKLLENKVYSNFVKWSPDNEIPFVDSINCGIMPLNSTTWEKGKCGFKILQYLSRGKVVIADYTDVNRKLLINDNGFLVDENWLISLKTILSSNHEFIDLKKSEFIKSNYSIHTYEKELHNLFIHTIK